MVDIEQKILDVVYNCGGITKKGIEKIAGNSDILAMFLDKKLLKKQPVDVQNKRIALYTITDVGERYYTDKTGKKHFYRCSRGEKVVALSYFYISEIDGCTDWQNKDEWYSQGESGLIPDATYVKDGELFGVAIVRNNDREKASQRMKEFSSDKNIKQIKIMVQ